MPYLNSVTVAGHAGGDPEQHNIGQDGTLKVTFNVAVSKKWKDKQGQEQQRTSWIPVEVWPPFSRGAAEYVSKGALVVVQGELEEQRWQDKQTGGNRSKLVLRAKEPVITNRAGGGGQGQQQHRGREQAAPPDWEDDPEIPF